MGVQVKGTTTLFGVDGSKFAVGITSHSGNDEELN